MICSTTKYSVLILIPLLCKYYRSISTFSWGVNGIAKTPTPSDIEVSCQTARKSSDHQLSTLMGCGCSWGYDNATKLCHHWFFGRINTSHASCHKKKKTVKFRWLKTRTLENLFGNGSASNRKIYTIAATGVFTLKCNAFVKYCNWCNYVKHDNASALHRL